VSLREDPREALGLVESKAVNTFGSEHTENAQHGQSSVCTFHARNPPARVSSMRVVTPFEKQQVPEALTDTWALPTNDCSWDGDHGSVRYWQVVLPVP
jgi:hypothetical protein